MTSSNAFPIAAIGSPYAHLVCNIFRALNMVADPRESHPAEVAIAPPPLGLGRPFVVEGEARVAGANDEPGWGGALEPSLAGLDTRRKARLAAEWLADGLDEHASVASFARFTLQLMALGAPPELLRASHRAGLDEIAHAELCFGLASAYGDSPRAPGPLPVDASLGAVTLEAAALATVREGCIGETISAMLATAAAEQCDDVVITRVLLRIASDETRHAGLAWRFLRWALGRDPALAEPVRACFAAAQLAHPIPSRPPRRRAWQASRGRLTSAKRAAVAASTVRRVITPCAAALLDRAPRGYLDDAPLAH
jgi:hypothetical protein